MSTRASTGKSHGSASQQFHLDSFFALPSVPLLWPRQYRPEQSLLLLQVPALRPRLPPAHYTAHILLRGVGRPDDLAFDQHGRLLFSDEINGTISRLNADGSVTVLLVDPAGPEGLVVKPDGTIIFAEQDTNRMVSLAPGARTPVVLCTLPGTPSNASCKRGVDGIAFDPTTKTIIVPDSPIGKDYQMSLDGKSFTGFWHYTTSRCRDRC